MVGRAGMAGLVIVVVAGAWLVAAPFALRFQPSGVQWTNATRIDVGTGGALLLIGFVSFFAALSGRVRELYAETAAGSEPQVRH